MMEEISPFLVIPGAMALVGLSLWAFLWWLRRDQRRIKKEQEEGWKEAGRKH